MVSTSVTPRSRSAANVPMAAPNARRRQRATNVGKVMLRGYSLKVRESKRPRSVKRSGACKAAVLRRRLVNRLDAANHHLSRRQTLDVVIASLGLLNVDENDATFIPRLNGTREGETVSEDLDLSTGGVSARLRHERNCTP